MGQTVSNDHTGVVLEIERGIDEGRECLTVSDESKEEDQQKIIVIHLHPSSEHRLTVSRITSPPSPSPSPMLSLILPTSGSRHFRKCELGSSWKMGSTLETLEKTIS